MSLHTVAIPIRTKHRPPKASGFESLPKELVWKICHYKCRHCRDPDAWLDSPADANEAGDLRALSMTCRQLRDIPQLVMFHDVHPVNILPLLRTLYARPELASLVQCFNNDLCMESWATEEDFSLFRVLAGRFHLDGVDEWMQKMRGHKFERQLWILEFTLALLPRVAALFITLPAGHVPGGLFTNAAVTTSSVKRLSLYHADYKSCKIDLGRLGNFLGMMPRLERLDVNFCGGITQSLPLHELRSLNFAQSNISAASLRRLCSPGPRRSIDDKADEQAGECTWDEMLRILAMRKSTLKHMDIGYHKYFPHIDGRRGIVMPSHLDIFARFDALEKLFLPMNIFPFNLDRNFSAMLPKSLTVLGLRNVPHFWNGVLVLATAVKQGRLPRLRKVVVDLDPGTLEKTLPWLTLVGMTCERYDSGRHPFGRSLPNYVYSFFNRAILESAVASIPMRCFEQMDPDDGEDEDEDDEDVDGDFYIF
ncbi:hypothetical protein ACQKWADRAFT_328091 [Trichoderma austrokoningii]